MTGHPPVSVIVPAYNAEAYLAETLERILGQTQPVKEILVIDDGSTDSTATIAKSFDTVQYVYQEHGGLSTALNHGIRTATHDLLAFCDADDIWPVDKQEIQLARLARFPEAELVLGYLQRVWFEEDRRSDPELLYSIGCSLVRRAVFEQVGFFDESMDFYEDWEWFLRVKEAQIRINIHPEIVTYYRQHGKSMTASEGKLQHNIAIMLKRAKDRKKQ